MTEYIPGQRQSAEYIDELKYLWSQLRVEGTDVESKKDSATKCRLRIKGPCRGIRIKSSLAHY